jgi:tetratricopeptide (TPR) repeat protein
MRVSPLVLSVAVLAGVAASAEAQLRSNRPQRPTANLPRLLVANPYAPNTADSAASVRIGDGMRRRMEDVAGRWFTTITRDQMNEALLQYAYPADAVLPPQVARTLASQLQSRFLVSSTLARTEGGRYSVQLRAVGINDRAGYATTLTQQAGQSLDEFGRQSADALRPSFQALEDARKCWDLQSTRPQDAAREAVRALRAQPNHGLAAYCLGEIAAAQNASRDSLITLWRMAVTGDPLSLDAWSKLATAYQEANDSVNTVRAFQEMLRVAPTNQPLREQAFRLFIAYGQPEAAKQVAEEGLALDESNADLWDLKSNACLFLEDFACAVDALEQVVAVDSAKADSAFFNKISVAASQEPDTVRLLKWARRGADKYPDNPTLLAHLATAYGYAGPLDSSVTVVQRLMAVDSSDLRPVLRTVQALAGAGRLAEAEPLIGYVERLGDENDRQSLAAVIIQPVQAMFQRPETLDRELALAGSRRAAALAVPGGQVHLVANFFLGLSAGQLLAQYDAEIMEARSCELARRSAALRDEAEVAMTIGQNVSPEVGARTLQGIRDYKARIDSQIRAFCR